jgi:hypothetical protein
MPKASREFWISIEGERFTHLWRKLLEHPLLRVVREISWGLPEHSQTRTALRERVVMVGAPRRIADVPGRLLIIGARSQSENAIDQRCAERGASTIARAAAALDAKQLTSDLRLVPCQAGVFRDVLSTPLMESAP